MPHLWVKDSGEWTVLELLSDTFALTRDPLKPVQRRELGTPAEIACMLRCNGAGGEHLFVLAPSENTAVIINGIPLASGIRILRDRDELRVGGIERMYFSTESLAVLTRFPGNEQAMYCPRCKREIALQTDAVKCPQCDAWYHQSEEFPCWVYSERCALCDQPSNLDAGYRWSPEYL